MKMLYTARAALYSIGYALAALIDHFTEAIIGGVTRAYHATIDTLTFAFDYMAPTSPDVVLATGHRMAPGREVRHLTTGLHMRAQPRSHLGDPDPEDEDDGEDALDNGLRRSMRC